MEIVEEATNVVTDNDDSSKLLDTPSQFGSIQESEVLKEKRPQFEISGLGLFKELNFYILFFAMVFITGINFSSYSCSSCSCSCSSCSSSSSSYSK
jgi:hypothetical protein